MNDIRINKEEEKEIVKGTFKISPGAILFWLAGALLFLFPILITTLVEMGSPDVDKFGIVIPIIFFGAIFIGFNILQILKLVAIHKNEFTVTNKRIYGVYHILISKKSFSYRLDEIENVEMNSTLGRHTLALYFSQGKGPTQLGTTYVNGVAVNSALNVFSITNLKNYKEIYDKMVSLLTTVKNVIDLETDIKMSRLEAENRKADALESVAKNIADSKNSGTEKKAKEDYITELRRLKELKDEGIITEEEFQQEKKEILDNNHK